MAIDKKIWIRNGVVSGRIVSFNGRGYEVEQVPDQVVARRVFLAHNTAYNIDPTERIEDITVAQDYGFLLLQIAQNERDVIGVISPFDYAAIARNGFSNFKELEPFEFFEGDARGEFIREMGRV